MTEKKTRKPTKGPIRDKERTYELLIDAVGKVLRKKGFSGLNATNITKEAKVNRALIYHYFGTVDNLITAYIRKVDFWTPDSNQQIGEILANPQHRGAADFHMLLTSQLSTVYANRDLQQILLWEISQKSKILAEISQEREVLGEQLFQFVEGDFKNSGLDLRAIIGLMIGGIYYLSLHATNNGSTFCGIDMNQGEGKQRFENALKQLINLCYEKTN
jgi:AcrR family transcriptional regulator